MEILLGHLVGDYLFQNNWMSFNKTKNTANGVFACVVHCLIYTACVALITWNFSIWWLFTIFWSHYFIDRFSLATYWLKLIRGRDIVDFVTDPWNSRRYTAYEGVQAGFNAIVYTVVDNTMHLLIMWYAWKLFFM